MKIRVTNSGHWYKAGEVYTVLDGRPDEDGDYRVEHPLNTDDTTYYVEGGDCEIITIDGRKAEITVPGRRFPTYTEFAYRHGYRDAASPHEDTDTRRRPIEGDIVTLLTGGPHLTGYHGETLWIVEAANGERHIISEKGLRILSDYNEVKRKANVGERIKITEWDESAHISDVNARFGNGSILTVAVVCDNGKIFPKEYVVATIKLSEYVVLETPSVTSPPSVDAPSVLQQLDGLTEAVAKLTLKTAELENEIAALKIAKIRLAFEPPTTSSDSRDDVIENAKRDVAELLVFERSGVPCSGRTAVYYPDDDVVKFVIDREKGTVDAQISIYGKMWTRGISKCAPNEIFNTHIGRAIALRRALGLDVPDMYVNAPKPTEARVGDIVHFHGLCDSIDVITTLTARAYAFDGLKYGKLAFRHAKSRSWIADKQFRIIDDSREEVGV